jgi:hypothetical protein
MQINPSIFKWNYQSSESEAFLVFIKSEPNFDCSALVISPLFSLTLGKQHLGLKQSLPQMNEQTNASDARESCAAKTHFVVIHPYRFL